MSARARRGARRAAAVALSCVALWQCSDAKSGPNTPFSIQFDPPQLPSMLVGDVLHDTLGNFDSLHAVVFNASGDTIHDAPVRYIRADTTHILTVDSVSGHVIANDTGSARVVAQATGLQSPPDTLFVVSRPDAFAPTMALNDSIDFVTKRDSLFGLSVGVTAGGIAVNHWRVEYSFIYPASFNDGDSAHVLLTNENRKFSLVDTTGANLTGGTTGIATRFLSASTVAKQYDDTVVVEARAFYPDHTVVPGSPQRFKVLVHIP